MLGRHSGFGALGKSDTPHIIVPSPPTLAEVLQIVIECVNYVRNSSVKHRILKDLCNEMGLEFEVLLYHSNVRWLSRGKVLNRVFAKRVELVMFCNVVLYLFCAGPPLASIMKSQTPLPIKASQTQ